MDRFFLESIQSQRLYDILPAMEFTVFLFRLFKELVKILSDYQ